MVLKTFNLDEEVYRKFSEFCKENGMSMSKQVNIFIEAQIEEEPEVREEYMEKLKRISAGLHVGPFSSIEELDKHIGKNV